MVKSKGMELMECVENLQNIETLDTMLTFGIFRSSARKRMEISVNELQAEINDKMKLYQLTGDMEINDKNNNIIQRYKAVLDKIYEEFENSVISTQLEMQTIEGNQKIAIASFKKISDAKKEVIRAHGINLSQTPHPAILADYEKKENACIAKFNDYNSLLDSCLVDTETNRREIIEKINSIKLIDPETKITKPNGFFQKLKQKFNIKFKGKELYQKSFLNKIDDNLKKLEVDKDETTKETREKNIKFIATVIAMKRKINNRFKVAVS